MVDERPSESLDDRLDYCKKMLGIYPTMQGWQCPNCGACFNWAVDECVHCKPQHNVTITTTGAGGK